MTSEMDGQVCISWLVMVSGILDGWLGWNTVDKHINGTTKDDQNKVN
jgi:hypothetical protein